MIHKDGTLIDSDIIFFPEIEVSSAGRCGTAVVSGSIRKIVYPLVEREHGFVGTSDHPTVTAYDFLVQRKIRIQIRKIFMRSAALAENIVYVGLIVKLDIEIAVTGGKTESQNNEYGYDMYMFHNITRLKVKINAQSHGTRSRIDITVISAKFRIPQFEFTESQKIDSLKIYSGRRHSYLLGYTFRYGISDFDILQS